MRSIPKEDGGIGFFAACFVRDNEKTQLEDNGGSEVRNGCCKPITDASDKAQETSEEVAETLNTDTQAEWTGFND